MKILIFRLGAFGDVICTTPAVRLLHEMGHKIVYVCNERGVQVLKNNPHIETVIEQKADAIPMVDLPKHIEWLRKKHKCELVIDYSESIECALAQHPRGPGYKLPKQERLAKYNRNYYEFCIEWTLRHLKLEPQGEYNYKPELFFEPNELLDAYSILKPGYFNILIGMSGSGSNKAWPHTEELCKAILAVHPEIHIITVGDERCQMIEPTGDNITNLSGKISMRTSMALTGIVDLVISPDTGLLHASGCYDTHKIGIIGHNTIECLTKHFTNDHSVMADPKKAECAPCLFLVYNMALQCPEDKDTGAVLCMGKGIVANDIYTKFLEVYNARV